MLLKLFFSFLKIGAFTIGGAYAMIPLIRKEVCETHNWISDEEFMDGLAAAQSCPGPIAVNISIYVGYHIAKGKGMAVAVLGTIIPSITIIMLVAMLFNNYADADLVKKAFHALRPAVVALIAVPLVQMARRAGVNIRNLWYPLLSAVLVGVLLISPMYLISATIVFAVWQGLRAKQA
ncbi:MAG: chromate transporter [Candidatus Cloacimonetes bacterium HGW-Cloacimonetes-3]|jgi:chromate transporter|nr:MAG: chromate transporter [Candidatus Cloacimonetes bacterium HGW-Cloacimonetes-3]